MGFRIDRYNGGLHDAFAMFARQIWPDDPRKTDPGYMKWLYGDGSDRPSGLYLFLHDDRVIGSMGTFPVEWRCGRDSYRALWIADFFLLPEHRNRGLGVLLLKEAEKETDVLLTTGMSEVARDLYQKLQWHEYDRPRLFLYLRNAAVVAARYSESPYLLNLAHLADPFLRLRLALKRPEKRSADLSVIEVDRPDPRIEELWDRYARTIDVAATRTPEWIVRRYFDEPAESKKVWTAEKEGEMIGVVYTMHDRDKSGFRRGRILDCYWEPSQAEAGPVLLGHALEALLESDPDYITCISALPEFDAILGDLGFIAAQKRPIMWHGPEVSSQSRWHFTLGDSDSGLGP